jgi:hypothetical protein
MQFEDLKIGDKFTDFYNNVYEKIEPYVIFNKLLNRGVMVNALHLSFDETIESSFEDYDVVYEYY